MLAYHVYHVSLSGASREIGPEQGFEIAGHAHGYALAVAASGQDNRNLYLVVGNNQLLAVYPGAGLKAAGMALDRLAFGEDEEYFAEAA